MQRYLTILLALALLTTACGGANGTDGRAIEQTRPVTGSGSPPPVLLEGGQDSAVINTIMMLELSGASFDGTPISIANDGRPKVILFLTHW